MSGTDTTSQTTDVDASADTPAPEATTSTPTDSTPPPSSGTDSTPAPSSGDTPLSDRDGLLAAVRKVVDKPADPAADPVPGQAADPAVGTDKAGTSPGAAAAPQPDATSTEADPTDAELRKLRPETRRRFEKLLSQRNDAQQALTAVQPELAVHRQLQGYLTQHQLAPDDVNMLLGVGAALRRGDFQAFLNGVTPYVQAAQEALGIRLSGDLQKQVDDGLISEEAARELTRTRHRAAQAEGRADQQTQIRTQETQTRNIAAVRTAIETWEDGIKKRDPDYALKAVAVRRFSQALLQERGVPQTPGDAVAMVEAAYTEASAQFQAMRPAPQPTRRAPSGINGVTHGAVAEPKTMHEAISMTLQNMRRAS